MEENLVDLGPAEAGRVSDPLALERELSVYLEAQRKQQLLITVLTTPLTAFFLQALKPCCK